jgi:NAD(P)-dependent dehydrogenase (short-subunit alcohol dehydrogenase family)
MRSVGDLINLQGRVALITGGAGYLGSTIGQALAELGANIVLLDIQREQGLKISAQIEDRYEVEVQSVVVNMEDEGDLRSAADQVLTRFGRLDILIHCAALVGTSQLSGWAVPFGEQDADTWRKALEVNLTAPFILTQACVKALAASGYGSVINISSIYGVVGADPGLYEDTQMGGVPGAYAASKGGLVQWTRWLAADLAPEIRVNTISMGGVWRGQHEAFHQRYKERTPLKRMATEEDVKGAVVYLASDLSLYVTGQNLMVDGGWTAW